MTNINKEFVEKKIKREGDCFLIDFYQYQNDIYKENNIFLDQYIYKI
jgi:hypothetical protein